MKKTILLLGLLAVCLSAAAGDDFLEAYRLALGACGVNPSYEELACIIGMPFTPLKKSDVFCGRDADKPYSCSYNVQRLNNFYRLRNEEKTFTPKDQLSSVKKTEYRKLIADSKNEGVPALQYAKLPGQLAPCWQYVEPGTGLTLRAVYGGKQYVYQGVPEKVWLLKKSARPASTETPQVFIWENLGKLLNGTSSVSYFNCGVSLLRDMADSSYALPWCPECNSPFNNCVLKHLARWHEDALAALNLFPWMRQLVQNSDERALLDQAEREYRTYCEGFNAVMADPEWQKPQTDLAKQTIMGEKIRTLTLPLMSCAECFFSLANKKNSLSQEYYSPSKRSQINSDRLANVIVDMQVESRYEGSLACALTIAGQLSGCDRPVFVTRSIAGLPFRLALRTNDWYFCREINEGVDSSGALAEACGFRARYLTTRISDPEAAANDNNIKRVYDAAVRKVIENISQKKHALVGANLNRSGSWGVIAGYSDYGFTWLGRSVLESKPQMLEFTTLPTDMILIDSALPRPNFEDDAALALSRWIKMIKGTHVNGVLTGGRLLSFWMTEVARWANKGELPSPNKASVNRSLWSTMTDGRADALLFVNHLIKAVPIISIPMTEARDILERELTVLRSAQNNGYILNHDGARYLPTRYEPAFFNRQVEVMTQIAELDTRLLLHLASALKTLE